MTGQTGYSDTLPGQNAPASAFVASVGDDANDVANAPARSLFVTVAGNVKFTDWQGNVVGPVPLPVGVVPVRIKRLWATGLTATVFLLY